MLRLARADIGILSPRVEIMTWPTLLVKAQEDLFARLVLGRDVLPGQTLDAVVPAPGQGVKKTFGSLGFMPFRGAEVA
jgi:hypothetical protein